MELFEIKMNGEECSRSVPIRNVPLHRKELDQQQQQRRRRRRRRRQRQRQQRQRQ